MTASRPLRMLGALLVLLAGLATLWLGVEIVMDRYRPLMEYGNHTTAYGWGVFAQVLIRVATAGTLFWLFAQLSGSKPLPHVSGSN
jgi:hypothetical protein